MTIDSKLILCLIAPQCTSMDPVNTANQVKSTCHCHPLLSFTSTDKLSGRRRVSGPSYRFDHHRDGYCSTLWHSSSIHLIEMLCQHVNKVEVDNRLVNGYFFTIVTIWLSTAKRKITAKKVATNLLCLNLLGSSLIWSVKRKLTSQLVALTASRRSQLVTGGHWDIEARRQTNLRFGWVFWHKSGREHYVSARRP